MDVGSVDHERTTGVRKDKQDSGKDILAASIVVEGELAAMNTATGGRHCSTASIEEIRRSHIETAQSHKCVHRADRLALFGVLSPLAAEKQGVDNLE